MRAVVVGAGVMGRWHAHALRRLGHDVVAVVDPDEAAATALARAGSSRPYAELSSCLAEVDTDVVHVCTPPGTHAELIGQVLAGGHHVLAEKPLAASLSETESLLAAADAAGLQLAPVHQMPFQPGFRRVLARRNELGELVRVSYWACSAGGDGLPAEQRRSLLLEILPHPVSLLRRLVPDFEPLALELRVLDDDELALGGRAGRVQLDVSISLRGRPTRNELHVAGTAGSAFADLYHGYGLVESGRVSRVAKAERPFRLGGGLLGRASLNLASRAVRREPAYPGLRELVRTFYASVSGRGEPPVPHAEVRAAAVLADAVRARAIAGVEQAN